MSDYMLMNSVHEVGLDIKGRTIFLHGATSSQEDSDPGVDWRMATRFRKNMYILDTKPASTLIHQQNIGGEWESGMSIYDTILTSPSHSTMVCHGEVYSMGTVILQAADLRLSMPNCTFLFHYGDTSPTGPWKSVESAIKCQSTWNDKMLAIYANRCKEGDFFKARRDSLSRIKTYISSKFKTEIDWYLDAQQAKHFGFIDGIIGEDYQISDI